LFVSAWRWFVRPQGARRDGVAAGDFRAGILALYDDYEQDGDAVVRLMAQEERIPAVREMLDSGRAYHRAWVARTKSTSAPERQTSTAFTSSGSRRHPSIRASKRTSSTTGKPPTP